MILVEGVKVPVVWRPSDLAGPDSDGEIGRRGQVIRAGVNHRVVGYLESMTNTTFAPSAEPHLAKGERRVSSHFGIGFWGDELRIVQYVALENTAYCNGQTLGDRAALLSIRPWPVYSAVRKAAGRHVSANYFTYSIEHEDNAKAGGYVVREEIIAASIEGIGLDPLLARASLWDALGYRVAGWAEQRGGKRGNPWPTIVALSDAELATELGKAIAHAFNDNYGYHVPWADLGVELGIPLEEPKPAPKRKAAKA